MAEAKDDYDSSDESSYAPSESEGEEEVEETQTHEDNTQKSESEKQRLDDLFADFLTDGGQSASTSSESSQSATSSKSDSVKTTQNNKEPEKSVPKPKEKTTVTEIFDFAGEEVRVEKLVEQPKTEPKKKDTTGIPAKRRLPPKPASGLSSLLKAIDKKPKMSTYNKTKLDWNQFKDKEGISDELEIHNRGKDGYLAKQDFLQMADVRQHQIELEKKRVKK